MRNMFFLNYRGIDIFYSRSSKEYIVNNLVSSNLEVIRKCIDVHIKRSYFTFQIDNTGTIKTLYTQLNEYV